MRICFFFETDHGLSGVASRKLPHHFAASLDGRGCLCVSRFHNKAQSLAKVAGLYLATRLRDLAQWPQLLDIAEKVSMASAITCFLANFIR